MQVPLFTLQNRFLTARFSTADGKLVHISASGRGPSLIADVTHRYLDKASNTWHDDGNDPTNQRIEFVRCESDESSITAIRRTEHIELTIRHALHKDSPLLRVVVRLKSTGKAGQLAHVSLPLITFASDFNDAFEDERDLYFDGAELGNGRELPCWRVFFRRSHAQGLILATRSKANMAHFNILARALECEPHGHYNYSTYPKHARSPLNSASRTTCVAEFEIGPWTKSNHARVVKLARLDQPVHVGHPRAQGRPNSKLKGVVFHAVEVACSSAGNSTYKPNQWMIAKLPWAQKGHALIAGSGVRPPQIRFNPKLTGLHRVFVGIGNGDGIRIRLSRDPETSIRMVTLDSESIAQPTAFSLFLAGKHQPREVEYGVTRMDGQSVVIERFPSLFGTTVFDYVRFEKLSPAQARAWEATEDKKPRIELSGFHDIPDLARLTDVNDPDPAAYRANIWEHARCGFKRIYWRIDGQCSDFPSRHNTMRYVSAKVHGVYHPPSKAYGRVLKKANMLALAAKAAKKYGVELYGWMRFNNYSGNVQSDFFKKNPQFHEEWENGEKAGKLCLGIPEVRKHKIDILLEAASYGLPGLNLGFLRHPPILLFHPVLVKSYQQKCGVLPPRDPKNRDPRHDRSLPPSDEEHTRWFQHRADAMTIFGRELRAALRAKGLSHVKVSIWIRPNHCLFDGIDLPAWLDQGLCDEVVVNGMIGPELCYSNNYDPEVCGVRPEWKKMVQAKVRLVRCLAYEDFTHWQRDLPRADIDSYDGLCTYESDWAVLDSKFIALYRSFRQ